MATPCSSCPYLEYQYVRGDSTPFCVAHKPGKGIAQGIASRVCVTPQHRNCKSYTETIIDVQASTDTRTQRYLTEHTNH